MLVGFPETIIPSVVVFLCGQTLPEEIGAGSIDFLGFVLVFIS
jgi:hypothetical protein